MIEVVGEFLFGIIGQIKLEPNSSVHWKHKNLLEQNEWMKEDVEYPRVFVFSLQRICEIINISKATYQYFYVIFAAAVIVPRTTT